MNIEYFFLVLKPASLTWISLFCKQDLSDIWTSKVKNKIWLNKSAQNNYKKTVVLRTKVTDIKVFRANVVHTTVIRTDVLAPKPTSFSIFFG
jgi:hypothetical protein